MKNRQCAVMMVSRANIAVTTGILISAWCKRRARIKPGFVGKSGEICTGQINLQPISFKLDRLLVYEKFRCKAGSVAANDHHEVYMEKRKARVLVADDEPHIRSALISSGVTSLGAEVVAEAADGEQAMSPVTGNSCRTADRRHQYAEAGWHQVLKQIMAINNRTLV